jgi:hypothetical protein
LAAVLIGEAMLAFAAEDMGDDLCDVTQRYRSEFMVLPDGNREDTLLLRLLRVQQEILSVEASPTHVSLPSPL